MMLEKCLVALLRDLLAHKTQCECYSGLCLEAGEWVGDEEKADYSISLTNRNPQPSFLGEHT
jgi:hypothetical protein